MEIEVIKLANELFDTDSITKDSKMGDVEAWDSLGQINLFMAIENELGINCDPDEIILNDSIATIVELLHNKNSTTDN